MPPAAKPIIECEIKSFPGSSLLLKRLPHHRKQELAVVFKHPTFYSQKVWLPVAVAPNDRLGKVLEKLTCLDTHEISDEFKATLLTGAFVTPFSERDCATMCISHL